MKFDLSRIKEFFPFDEFREGQEETIEYILKEFEKGKECVILEAPTGSGKSAIGMTVARFFQDAYYITIQKFLQSQIMNEFGCDEVVELKGRANYECTFYEREGQKLVSRKGMNPDALKRLLKNPPNCNEGTCRKKFKKFKCEQCFLPKTLDNGKQWGALKQIPQGMKYSACPYYDAVKQCTVAHTSVFNFASFLYQTSMTKGRWNLRGLLVADEAHNMEPELLNFIELKFNDKTLQGFNYELPNCETAEEYWIHFEENHLAQKVGELIINAQSQDNLKLVDEYTRILKKILRFREAINDGDEWIAECNDFGDFKEVTLKPIFVRNKTREHIFQFGTKQLLMSATILDVKVFCNALGLDRNKVSAYRMKNRFPVENRLIKIHSRGKITGGQKKQKEWGPGLVKSLDEVINKHKNQRGIIHTHNFSIARLFLIQSKNNHRFLYQHNFDNKEEMLEEHANSKDTIILAPAMHEGLDLTGTLSRFQIIAKVPYPNFYNNKQLSRRNELDPDYYNWLTALKLIQSYGRSIRSDTDYADTYILDDGIKRFLNQHKKFIPSWFGEAIDYKYKRS